MGHLYHSLPRGSGIMEEKGAERLYEPEVRKDQRKSPSEHDRITGLMNLYQLRSPAQDLHEMKPNEILAWSGKEFMSLHL